MHAHLYRSICLPKLSFTATCQKHTPVNMVEILGDGAKLPWWVTGQPRHQVAHHLAVDDKSTILTGNLVKQTATMLQKKHL